MIDIKKHLPYLTAVLGFSLAWLVKPSRNESATICMPDIRNGNISETQAKPSNSSNKKNLDSSRGAKESTSASHMPLELPEELVRMREGMANQLSQALSMRDHGFIRRMTELLGLSEEQQVSMLRLIERKRDSFHVFSPSSNMPQNLLERAEKAESDYHQALGQVLDQTQIAKYNDYKKQQAHNRAIANAKTTFAEVLKNIDLSEEQQSAVENALKGASLANQPNLDKTHSLYEAYDTMGYGAAAGPMASSSSANIAIEQAPDKAQITQEVIADRQRESAAQLEALRPILTTAQWEQYKSILESKDHSYYANIQPLMNSAPLTPSILDPDADH